MASGIGRAEAPCLATQFAAVRLRDGVMRAGPVSASAGPGSCRGGSGLGPNGRARLAGEDPVGVRRGRWLVVRTAGITRRWYRSGPGSGLGPVHERADHHPFGLPRSPCARRWSGATARKRTDGCWLGCSRPFVSSDCVAPRLLALACDWSYCVCWRTTVERCALTAHRSPHTALDLARTTAHTI